MPSIVKFRGQPYLVSWNAGVFDALPNLGLIAIRQSGVDVTVSFLKCDFDGIADFVRLALPCPEANGWDFGTSVESEGLSIVA